jgi:hypothetical protein
MRSHVTMSSFGMFKPLTSAVEDKPDEGLLQRKRPVLTVCTPIK